MTTADLIGMDPGWLIAVKALLVFAICVLMTLFAIWAERRVVARMQMRLGPNRVGKFGLLQSLADGVKLAFKEDLIPKAADKIVFILAPMISVSVCFLAFAVIPMSGPVTMFGRETAMQLTDFPVAVLYILAATAIGAYGIMLAGWSSGSVYPLLGGLRSTAQVISYELAMGLSLVAVFIYAGSMSTSEIVAAQDRFWFALILAVSALATTLFLGGYRALPGLGFTELWLGGWFTMVWFFAKVLLFFFFFIWLRGTLPRLRYDQFMKFGWKVLIPASLVWIMVVATLRALSAEGASQSVIFAFTFGIVLLVLAGTSVYEKSKKSAEARAKDVGDMPEPSFPVPVMPSEKGIVRGE